MPIMPTAGITSTACNSKARLWRTSASLCILTRTCWRALTMPRRWQRPKWPSRSRTMGKIKVAIAGCGGRMGKVLLECVAQADDLVLHAALEHGGSPLLGLDASVVGGARGVVITADAASALQGADALIDFTRPEGTLHHLEICRKHGV